MALQNTGQISLKNIADEFGDSAPHALSEFRGKGDIPASGEAKVSQAYGAANIGAMSYNTGVTEIVANDNSSTTVANSSHMVMGLRGRSNGAGGGNMGNSCSAVNCNDMFNIAVRSKAVSGASGTLTRGTISEIGPSSVGSANSCTDNVWTNQLCSSNKFLVGIRVNSIPHSFNPCLWFGQHYFEIYRREASFGNAIHNGSGGYSTNYNSYRDSYGPASDLATNRFGTGYSISTGGSGEYTDNLGWAWFGYRMHGQDALG